MSVVTTGRYMKVYDAVDVRVPEPPLSAALYSHKCLSFVTCNGPFVTLWDACTGYAFPYLMCRSITLSRVGWSVRELSSTANKCNAKPEHPRAAPTYKSFTIRAQRMTSVTNNHRHHGEDYTAAARYPIAHLSCWLMSRRPVRTDRAMEGDIMRACLDGGERRLLLASSLGEILVFRLSLRVLWLS